MRALHMTLHLASRTFLIGLGVSFALLCSGWAAAGEITPSMHKKIEVYKKKAVAWAANPEIVKAVREANVKGPIVGMGNAKWRELKESDPTVAAFVNNRAGQLLTQWMKQDEKSINKIVLSGNKSHRVAFTSMPAVYIGRGKPNFDEAFDGKVWQQGETKPDPSTQIESVQIAAPVREGREIIGVLLVSLTAARLQ